MTAPIINDLLLPKNIVLVLPDEGEQSTTGTITNRSEQGGGHFESSAVTSGAPMSYDHVLFVREMATEVNINDVEYFAMSECAVVGLIPD